MTRTEAIQAFGEALRLGGTPEQRRRWTACIARLSADTSQQRVRAAYRQLAAEPGAWVALARLRAELPDMPRDEQDAALTAIARGAGGALAPESNQKTLTQHDRAAAAWHGGQWKHLLSIQS